MAQKIKAAMRNRFSETIYFTDSSAVLGMLRADSASLLEFVGTRLVKLRVSEVAEDRDSLSDRRAGRTWCR